MNIHVVFPVIQIYNFDVATLSFSISKKQTLGMYTHIW